MTEIFHFNLGTYQASVQAKSYKVDLSKMSILLLYLAFSFLTNHSFSQTTTNQSGYILPNLTTSKASKDTNQYHLGTQDFIANVQHFGRSEGLSHRQSHFSFQDSRGFIWVGTFYGINRFDGHNFEIFTKEKDNLPFNEISLIAEDDSGWLWLFRNLEYSTNSVNIPIAFINVYTKEVQTFEQRFGTEIPIVPKKILSVVKDKRGSMYFGSNEGIVLKFNSKEGFKILPIENGRRLNLQKITEQGVLITTSETKPIVGEFMALDTLGNRLWTIENAGSYRFVGKDKKGKNWYWKYRNPGLGLLLFNIDEKDGKESSEFVVPGTENMILSVSTSNIFYSPKTDLFWCKSSALFFVFHPTHGVLFNFSKDHSEIIKKKINRIYFDNRENAWITTSNGLHKIQLKLNPFKTYFSLPLEEVDINNSFSARGMLVDDGYLWACSQNMHKKYRLNLQTNEVLNLGFLKKEYNTQKGANWTFPLNVVEHLNENELLFGAGDCMTVLNKHSLAYKIINPHSSLVIKRTWSIFKDQKNTYWAGIELRGLSYWDRQKDSLMKYQQFNEFEEFKNCTVYSFWELEDQQILLGTTKGIYLFHLEKGILDRFWTKGEGADYFPHNNVYHLVKDKEDENVFWVSTGGGGLIRWTVDGARWTEANHRQSITDNQQFTIEDGLSSNVIYAVYEDDNGNLWMPSEEGLMRFNKHTFQSKTYTTEDGIAHNEFNRISHYEHKDGTFYFGGLNGITAFHPNDLAVGSDVENIPLQITRFQQFDGNLNKIVDKTSEIVQNNEIVIAPNDKFFSIDLALLEYSESKSIRYAYKIDTQSEDWIYLNDNNLRISGLPYGNHVLRMKGQASSSQFSKQELTIPILVKKPIYLQTWFIVLAILIVVGALVFWYKSRTEALRQRQAALEEAVTNATETIRHQNEELKNLDKVKSRFFANVSHELRTPITLILGPLTSLLKSGELSGKSANFAELGRKNAKGLLNLVNEILDLTKMESGKIELKEEATQFYPFLDFLRSAFEGIAQQKNINYEFRYNTDKQLWLQLDPKKFEKLVNNLLSNAFKFTPPKGKISLQVEDKQDYLILAVQDSGRGIHPLDVPHVFDRFYQSAQPNAPKEGGTGIGLSLSMEFAKLMKGNLWVKSDLGKGSTFYFEFPKTVVSAPLPVPDSAMKDELEFMEITQEQEEITEAPHPITDNRQLTTENQQLEPATILLVEDNDNLREYIQIIIGEHYEVFTAENGRVAWEFLRDELGEMSDEPNGTHNSSLISHLSKTPDLIISDIMMPEMDGYQLLEKLKSSDRFRGIPIIMLTALADLKDKLKALRIGVDDYMTKPFEEEELLARVANLLKNSRERKAFYLQEKNTPAKKTNHNKTKTEKPEPNPTEVLSFSEEDSQWLEHLEAITTKSIGNFNFSLEQLAHELASNRWSVRRRIKQLTGLTATQYLKEIRLNHARHLLEDKVPNSVKALAYEVGVKDVKYFSQQFKQRFGKSPSEYL